MTHSDEKKLFDAIKQDNLSSFCMLVKTDEDFKISFGRFPLLSVCLLYESKKIIKKFFDKLFAVENYNQINEPFELYLKFKSVAEKSVRFYAGKENFVLPLEILAMQKKDSLLKKYYKIAKKSQKNDDFLQKIYKFNQQSVIFKNKNIKISRKKMSRKQKFSLIFSGALFGAISIVVATIFIVIANIYGFGTLQSPKKVYSYSDLLNLDGKDCYATILDDITIDDSFCWKDFSGTIFGNGKTITIDCDNNNYLIDNFSGKISDLDIVYKNGTEKTIQKNLSLFANKNDGEIDNVNIVVEDEIKLTFETTTVCFSGIATTNNGYIHRCSVKFSADITSLNTNDNLASFICTNNYGTISSCEVLEGSRISSINVDLGGIANNNLSSAEISSCKNYATLSQSTTSASWSPNVAGIVTTNNGTISNCINYGNLTANHEAIEKQEASTFVGGISAQNFSVIEHCKNTSIISSNTSYATIYAGGITAYTSQKDNSNPTISSCASIGSFDIQKSDDELFAYCGGISGFMIGSIGDSYVTTTFSKKYSEEKLYMLGLMIGASSGVQTFWGTQIYLDIKNIHCLTVEETAKTLAIVYTNAGYIFVENLSADITTHDDIQEIRQTDIYW